MDDEEELGELEDETLENPQNNQGNFLKNNMNKKSVPKALNRNKQNVDSKNEIPKKLNNPPQFSKKNNKNEDKSLKNKLKANKPLNMLGLGRKKKNDDSNSDDSSNEEDTSSNDNNPLKAPTKIVALMAKMKVAFTLLIISVIGVILFIVFAAVYDAFSWVADAYRWVSNLFSSNHEMLPAEYRSQAIDYYNAINTAADDYFIMCNDINKVSDYDLNLYKNYLQATLLYKYYMPGENDKNNNSDNHYMADMYTDMKLKIATVAMLMGNNYHYDITTCPINLTNTGNYYNNLLNSDFLKEYYNNGEELFFDKRKEIVDNIFYLAETGIELMSSTSIVGNQMFVNDKLEIEMGTCEQPYNNNLLNAGSNYSSSISFSKYLMGVVYGELGDGNITEQKIEALKALTVAATSHVLNRTSYKAGESKVFVHNGNCWQLSCDINEGCTYAKTGKYGTTFTGNVNKSNIIFRKKPLSSDKTAILNKVINDVFGVVMLTSDGKYSYGSYLDKTTKKDCLSQQDALKDAVNGMDYTAILNKYYSNVTITNLKEDLYDDNVDYAEGSYNGNVVFYSQGDYKNKFCGRTNGTISSSGCGVTSMAMILSTFVDKSYDPPKTMIEAQEFNSCGPGISGTLASFFKKSAAKHGLGYQEVGKSGNLQAVTNALTTGKSLVIAHMGPGTFTNGGHYIVLSKVNEKGEVYVFDPNKGRRTGWHDFNLVVKQLKGSFHIITKG